MMVQKVRVFFIILIGVVWGFGFLPQTAAKDAEKKGGVPKIQFAELTHDFGTVNQNSELRHTFTFKNIGTEVLRIDKVSTSCGCTAALLSDKEIAPGGEGKIEAVFKTAGFQGRREKTITVTCNDPEHPTTTLTISADIQVVLDLSPNRIMVGQIKKDEQAVRYAALAGTQKDSVRITSVDNTSQFLKVETNLKGFENDPQKQIKVMILPGRPIGRFNERVVLKTDHPQIQELSLYVMGEVTGNIVITPNFLHFGMFEPGTAVERVLTVRAAGQKTFRVVDVKTTVPEVITILETVQQGTEYRIRARLSEKFSGDIVRGQLTITTDDADQQQIEVNMFGRKARKPQAAAPLTR
ncbi:MAG: DUF1573 domain-containing protein [Desulfobacterota bacterium]|nr:DUF1573 domain-containing protein [Thermodesulfobacteriota bacterium]